MPPKKPPQLPLALPVTRARAWELVAKFPIGSRLYGQYRTTKGKKYGPYYTVAYMAGGEEKQVYLGSESNKRELEAAWELVGSELAAAEQSPEVRRLRELEARAGLARTRAVVSLPKEVATGSRPK